MRNKWRYYDDSQCFTYPDDDGYYWVAFTLDDGTQDTHLAYWVHFQWWIADSDITDNVWAWKKRQEKYPKLPTKDEVFWI